MRSIGRQEIAVGGGVCESVFAGIATVMVVSRFKVARRGRAA